MRMSAFMVWLVLGLTACGEVREGEPSLHLSVAADASAITAGQWATFQVTIENRDARAVTLVRPGDGSDVGWRTPIIGWSVLPVDAVASHPPTPPPRRLGRCGNINALKPDALVTLRSGEQFTYGTWIEASAFPEPGEYRLVFYYRNDPDHTWSGIPLGEHDRRTMRRVRGSDAGLLVSEELRVTVEPTP